MNYFERQIWADSMFHKTHAAAAMPNALNAKAWMERIENELSPENLSCDGALGGAALQRKSTELQAAYRTAAAYLPKSSLMPDAGSKDGMSFSDPGFSDQFSGRHDQGAFHANSQYRMATRGRTSARMNKLNAAVHAGFTVGVRVLLKNGVYGEIVKINRTRVKVKGEDSQMWSVPPSCMQLAGPAVR